MGNISEGAGAYSDRRGAVVDTINLGLTVLAMTVGWAFPDGIWGTREPASPPNLPAVTASANILPDSSQIESLGAAAPQAD